MKNYVLVFLLFLLAAQTNAQENNARKIVKAAFQKATGGKPLTTFELEITYELPAKIPTELAQPNPMLMLLDSLMPTLPDSMQKSIKLQIDSSIAKSYQDRIEMFKDHRKLISVDIANKKMVVSQFSPDIIRGSIDTSRVVYGINKEVPFTLFGTENPILLLQLMASDTSELHYTGSAMLDQNEQHLIQVKIEGKWIDTCIDKKSLLLSQFVTQQVDTDPLIGRGPVYYKRYYRYSNYKRLGQYWLPESMEEISSTDDLTTKMRVTWLQINKSIPSDAFRPEPTYEERTKFKVVPIRDSLYVVIQFGNSFNKRSLLRISGVNEVDTFMEPIDNEVILARFIATVTRQFPQKKIRDTYYLSNQGLSIPIDQSMERNGVKAYVINPNPKEEWGQREIFYYLPQYKLVFLEGNSYWFSKNTNRLSPGMKRFYEFTIGEKVQVEKIIFSESYLDDAPLEIGFEDFESRAKQ